MYINDLKEELQLNGLDGFDIGTLKGILLLNALYADDIALLTKTGEGLQDGLNTLNPNCNIANRWKLHSWKNENTM